VRRERKGGRGERKEKRERDREDRGEIEVRRWRIRGRKGR
jgi:hypothetical protein